MSNPAAPGIVQVEAVWLLNGELVENTFHYRVTGTIDATKCTAIANTYISWATTYVGSWSNQASLAKVIVTDLSSSSGVRVIVIPATAVVGNRVASPFPNAVSLALKRQTGLRGRKNRGRVYLFGLTEDMQSTNGQSILATYVSSFVSSYNTLLGNQSSANAAVEVILHRSLGTGTDVTSYTTTDSYFDTQRRRLPGHNRHR